MNATRFTKGFSEEIIFPCKQGILCLKVLCPHIFVFALKIFLKFFTMEGVKRTMEIFLMAFLKKFLFRASGPQGSTSQHTTLYVAFICMCSCTRFLFHYKVSISSLKMKKTSVININNIRRHTYCYVKTKQKNKNRKIIKFGKF